MCVATPSRRFGRDRQILVIGEAADVVADAGALGERRFRDRRPPSVNTYGHVESPHELVTTGTTRRALRLSSTFVTGRPSHPPMSKGRAFNHELVGALEECVEVEGRGRFVEGVLVAIEDPITNARDVQIERSRTQAQRDGRGGERPALVEDGCEFSPIRHVTRVLRTQRVEDLEQRVLALLSLEDCSTGARG